MPDPGQETIALNTSGLRPSNEWIPGTLQRANRLARCSAFPLSARQVTRRMESKREPRIPRMSARLHRSFLQPVSMPRGAGNTAAGWCRTAARPEGLWPVLQVESGDQDTVGTREQAADAGL